mmetsp:Transcript_49931/g.67939  ORF Transcript_49931/g.67939 Transcript_49931/m.67939 type:complete len:83 (+) Transcript_49931:249-497(+)|eukprot:CAMPEP_0185761062 /NCGR_PEP_ID=MMETSP1174-20130828/19968_1 /TAXON_ID=35687 /ORGANISM="Dictyocha speculum, Strain CCMP1381" /LENGTH=82 /DNA_ID=CAMNT_0028442131 /DNA_START=239 /DNA_END=487 /DNA_ORIENTATION=+
MSVEMQTDEMGEVIPVAPLPRVLKADESAMTASSETQTDKVREDVPVATVRGALDTDGAMAVSDVNDTSEQKTVETSGVHSQ